MLRIACKLALLGFVVSNVFCQSPSLVFFEDDPGSPGTRFIARGPGRLASLASNGMMLESVKLDLVNAASGIRGKATQTGTVNYFIGDDSRTGLAAHSRVEFASVYPGIDLGYHRSAGALEFDFIVAPQADASQIRLALRGASAKIDEHGDLVASTRSGEVRWKKPIAYQAAANGQRTAVPAAYRRRGREISFELGRYDRSRPLIIDPVLAYSTFLGGSLGANIASARVATDPQGNVYVCGATEQTGFPPSSTAPATISGTALYVIKLSADLSRIVYATYYSGTGTGSSTQCNAFGVDSTGAAIFGGYTTSLNLPRVGAPFSGPERSFVAKLGPSGSALVYSTYIDGADGGVTGIAVAPDQTTYVGAFTSADYTPVKNPLFTKPYPLGTHGLVLRLTSSGALDWYTFLGGAGNTSVAAVAADVSGVYVTGVTGAPNFPLRTPAQPDYHGAGDAFVTKIRADGTSLGYSTYLGGANLDVAYAIAVDAQGNAYVTGVTGSNDFPLKNPTQQFKGADAFITKLSPDGSSLGYSTFLGGNRIDAGFAIVVDASGSAYVTGSSESTDFPLKNAFQDTQRSVPGDPSQQVSAGCLSDGFATRLSPDGSTLLASSLVGSKGCDTLQSAALDANGNLYAAGYMDSKTGDFPTTSSALVKTAPASYAQIVIKISPNVSLTIAPASLTFSYDPTKAAPGPQTITVGGELVSPVSVTAGASWLTATASSPSTPATIQVSVNPAGLAIGQYNSSITISVPASDTPTRVIPVQLSVVDPPVVTQIVNAASFATGTIATGEFVTVKGSAFSKTQNIGTVPYPSVLGGIEVAVEDSIGMSKPAALQYADGNQINFVVPTGLTTGSAKLTVKSPGGPTVVPVTISFVAPGLFTATANGQGPPAAVVQYVATNGTQTTDLAFTCTSTTACRPTPIRIGPSQTTYLTLYGTGLRNRATLGDVSAQIGSTALRVLYAGEQADFPGLDQINVLLPASLSAGPARLLVTVEGRQTNAVDVEIVRQ